MVATCGALKTLMAMCMHAAMTVSVVLKEFWEHGDKKGDLQRETGGLESEDGIQV